MQSGRRKAVNAARQTVTSPDSQNKTKRGNTMNKEQKRAFIAKEKDKVNVAKSRLIDIWNNLLAEGCEKEADQLGKIIGRLEAWQNK